MKTDVKTYFAKAIALILCIALVLLVVSAVAFFGGTIMSFFGFRYDSIWNLLLYFLIVMILFYPFEIFAGAIPRVLFHLGKISKPIAIILYLALDILVTYIGFSFVDSVMTSVSATPLSIVVLAVLLSLFGIKDIDKKPTIINTAQIDETESQKGN